MAKERILITGGAGYLWSVLTEHFLHEGYKVTCLDSLAYKQNSLFSFATNSNFNFVYGDCKDERVLEKLVSNADTIIPLAAVVGLGACNAKPFETRQLNYEAAITLNDIRSESQKLIFPNTNSGYGTKSGEIYCTEETPLEPISLYGITKAKAEQSILESGKDAISLRLATVFGISPRMRTDLLVNDFVLKALKDKYIVLYEAKFKRNFIHIKDVARAFEHCIENFDSMKNQVYNVGLENANLSKLELAEKIKSFIPKFEIICRDIGEDPDKRDYIVSNKKIMNTGFKPLFSLDDGIQELIKGYEILMKNDPYQNN